MQNSHHFSTRRTKAAEPKPKRRLPLVYVVLGLCFCIFAGSVWFSSYAKKVALQRKPVYETRKTLIQDEIHQLELEEATLTSITRMRRIADELGMVEPGAAARVLQERHHAKQSQK